MPPVREGEGGSVHVTWRVNDGLYTCMLTITIHVLEST